MHLENQTILIISNEPWGDVWFSKQHYAYELSKLGHQVYFINPTSKWNWFNIFSCKVIYTATSYENITIVNYKNNFPQTIFKQIFTKINDFITCIKLNKNIVLNNPNLIWWKFDPYRFLSSFPFNKNKHIYHVVDPYNLLWQDKKQAIYSDLIICVNEKYIDYYKKISKKQNIILIPHGISSDEVVVDELVVGEVCKKYGNFVVLVGNIAQDVNLEILKHLADNNINVLIIGGVDSKSKSWEELLSKENIYFIGNVHAKKIKNYIAASQAGLIVYEFKDIINENSRTPLKTMNYLSQKKPIITSQKTTLVQFENKGIFYAKDSEEFLQIVKKSINGKLYLDEIEIKKYLEIHNYPILIEKIFNYLN